jgi:hypothetical protein
MPDVKQSAGNCDRGRLEDAAAIAASTAAQLLLVSEILTEAGA